MKRAAVAVLLAVTVGGLVGTGGGHAPSTTTAGVPPTPLHEASLRNSDYGSGAAVDTMDPDHGGSPHELGIVDSGAGVTFISTENTHTPTEDDDWSNALINWVIPEAERLPFRTSGTVSFTFTAARETPDLAHVTGEILGDNNGYDQYHNGQATFRAFASRLLNDACPCDDQVQLDWSVWENEAWSNRDPVILEYDQLYNVGYAWGGPEHDFEIWVDGGLCSADSQGGLPWGGSAGTGSATNFGLGDNDERGHSDYGSAAGVTFTDIAIWNEYRPQGDTQGDGSADIDGDGLNRDEEQALGTNPCRPDTDRDQCTDGAEIGPDEGLGGQRDPLNLWDFFDVPAGAPLERDGDITAEDIFAVIARFNATDSGPGDFDQNSDPFSTPNEAVLGAYRANYHPAYDRGELVGPNPWNLGAPNGSITAGEIFAVIAQFGHSCA